MLNTPVLFIIFNRPEPTKRVFEVIREIKPKQLFIAADGPRANKDEAQRCTEAREIALQVNWECDVKTLFKDQNLGCGLAVSEAITWFFSHVEAGIVLEDDCLPDKSFFYFCEELLNVYVQDEKVLQISGCNFQNGKWRGEGDYYFSKLPQMWGWASWRRAWKHYQFDIDYNEQVIYSSFKSKALRDEWTKVLKHFSEGHVDTWDYQWMYMFWKLNGLVVVPNRNLILNLGFGDDATHTNFTPNYYSRMKFESMTIPVKHPEKVEVCEKADIYEQKVREGLPPLWQRAGSSIKRFLLRFWQ